MNSQQPGGASKVPGRASSSVDVARLAGVSQKTVSRVMNDAPHVRAEVRELVLRAARELNYRPNSAARTLISGRTRRIGMVTLGSALFGPASQLMAVERAARNSGYSLTVVNTFDTRPQSVADALLTLHEQGVDGVVLSEPIDEGPVDVSIEVPVVTLGRFPGLHGPYIYTSETDSSAAAFSATEYLLGLGHETVWHIAGPDKWWTARDRCDGWRRALEQHGAPVNEPIPGDWTPETGYKAGQVLAATPGVTAVLAANDDMALGLIRALTEAGLNVPADVSIVGFDDIPAAAFLNPPLTTVDQKFNSVATNAVHLLVRAIEAPDETPSPTLSTATLVVRDSATRPPARRDPAGHPGQLFARTEPEPPEASTRT